VRCMEADLEGVGAAAGNFFPLDSQSRPTLDGGAPVTTWPAASPTLPTLRSGDGGDGTPAQRTPFLSPGLA
jgi:hypothetical protein